MTIDGRKIAEEITAQLKEKVNKLPRKPKLAIVLVGDDEASKIYVNLKVKKAAEIGIETELIHITDNTDFELITRIRMLNDDKNIDGIIIQLPLPQNFDTERIINLVDVNKDIDGLSLNSKFLPATV